MKKLKRFLNICVVLGLSLLLNGISFADKVYFYHTDATGTPLAMTDENGNVVWEADYKPFGEEQEVTPYPENNKMFIGKEKDQETGLYYFGARYMDAGIGRFTTPDPKGISESDLLDPQRLNRYNYSLNNPYRYVDPDGEAAILITDAHKESMQQVFGWAPQWVQDIMWDIVFDPTVGPVAMGNIGRKAAGKGVIKALKNIRIGKDIAKDVKRFVSKLKLGEQIEEYKTVRKTYQKHLEKYSQEPGMTTGETNQMERKLKVYRKILEERGKQFGHGGEIY